MDRAAQVITANKALFVLPIPVLAMPIIRVKEIAPVVIAALAPYVFLINLRDRKVKTTLIALVIYILNIGYSYAEEWKPNEALPFCGGLFFYLAAKEKSGSNFQIGFKKVAMDFVDAGKSYNPQSEYAAGAYSGQLIKDEYASKDRNAYLKQIDSTAVNCATFGKKYGVTIKGYN